MKVIAIIQARMGSTRLPGKVLMDLEGKPLLARVVNRTRRAHMLDEVVIATTVMTHDDSIVNLCDKFNWPFFRGSEDDVLDRYYRAAKDYNADVIVRITSDCPLIDSGVIDQCVKKFFKDHLLDYLSNSLKPRTFPRGMDVEVVDSKALEKAWHEDNNPSWREHVTPYIYFNPDTFRIKSLANDVDYSYMRWTVDTEEDLEFVRRIYKHFGHNDFSWKDVLKVLEKNPEWLEINKHIFQREVKK